MQLHHTDSQIRLVEFVRNVPSQGTKVATLLHLSVEETQAEQEFLESGWLVARFEKFRIGNWVAQVRAGYVSAKTFWGFIRHFYPVL